jgi:hypothetical protein
MVLQERQASRVNMLQTQRAGSARLMYGMPFDQRNFVFRIPVLLADQARPASFVDHGARRENFARAVPKHPTQHAVTTLFMRAGAGGERDAVARDVAVANSTYRAIRFGLVAHGWENEAKATIFKFDRKFEDMYP